MSPTRLIDYHVHERHSGDARHTTIDNIVESAKNRGVKEVVFTTHYMSAGPSKGFGIKIGEIDEYLESIYEAQSRTSVVLRTGLEVDYFPEEERHIGELLSEYPFDFILGSVHTVNGLEIASGRDAEAFYSGRSIHEAVSEYFKVWKMGVESGLFDVMAHPDYFKKYLHLVRPEQLVWSDIREAATEPIDSLADYGVGFEVNTSCLRHGAGEFFPLFEFIEAAHDAGVKKVTVGSDTHVPETLGFRIAEALRAINCAGYQTVSLFKGRKEHRVPIEGVVNYGASSIDELEVKV